jgi:hypothetical protein
MSEIWKTINRHSEYEISDQGRVRSWKRKIPRILKPVSNHKGYLRVGLNGQWHTIHSLVLEAFVDPCPEGMQARHRDGNPSNNRLTNLIWGTPSQNQMDRVAHGTSNRSERHPRTKLTNQQVIEIRDRYAKGDILQRELAQEFEVRIGTIGGIIQRRSWVHV